MNVTKTQVKKLVFPPGETVHYGNAETWLALCGSGWLHVSNDPADVTCLGCLAILEEKEAETAVSQEVLGPVIKNMPDGRYELYCPECGISVIPELPCPMDKFLAILNQFSSEHNHTAVPQEVP